MKKAEILIEALPYLRKFHGKRMVIKVGGSVLDEEDSMQNIVKDIVLLSFIGISVLLVHGGGKHISKLMQRLGKESTFIEGLRVTDKDTMEITQMILSGQLNKTLVSQIEQHGGRAIGISGQDASFLKAKRLTKSGVDYGAVGEIVEVDARLLHILTKEKFIPVISPLASGDNKEALNVNADIAAFKIAQAIDAQRLIFITDVKGIYENYEEKTGFISSMNVQKAKELVKKKQVQSGMLPKIEAACAAISLTLQAVHFISGNLPHSLLLELFTQVGYGTVIRN